MKRILKEYWIDLSALLVACLGIFLIKEQVDINDILVRWISIAETGFSNVLSNLFRSAITYFKAFTLSDLLGWALVFMAGMFFFWRTRFRLFMSQNWLSDTCPRCRGPIMRLHRTSFDHFLGNAILPNSRRYGCMDKKCGWSGLRNHHLSRDSSGITTLPTSLQRDL